MKKAFTLAEVLITLGLIGVVAAIAMPSLSQNYQKRVYVTQLKKAYTSVSNAVDMYMSVNGITDLTESDIVTDPDNSLPQFINEYFKVKKDCHTRYDGCFAKSYKAIQGDATSDTSGSMCQKIITTVDGISFCFDTGEVKEGSEFKSSFKVTDNKVMTVEVDINGTEPPNVAGRDLFAMDVDKNGVVKDSIDSNKSTLKPWPFSIGNILDNNWQMKY